MRECYTPTIVALPFELVAEGGHREARAAQSPVDDAIKPVRDNRHVGVAPPAELDEGWEAGVEPDCADLCVKCLRRHAQQRHLSLQALARGDFSALPSGLDIAPHWIGVAFEQAIGGILWGDGPVEVDQDMPFWESFALRI
jgi:hypothetical protein